MSDMQRNKGIVKRLSTKENAKEVFDKLVAEGKFDPKWCDFDETSVQYIDSDDYVVVNGEIFDITGAPDERDPSEDGVNEAERLNETEYRVHAYFYNGGGSFQEMLEESIPRADKEYSGPSKVFYAVKMLKFGEFWSRGSSPTPALFTTEARALGTVKAFTAYKEDELEIVKFAQV